MFPLQNLACKELTHKQLEMHRCIISHVATDALVQKHQAIIIHNADSLFILLDLFHKKKLHSQCTPLDEITLWRELIPDY